MNAKLLKFARRAPRLFAHVYAFEFSKKRHARLCRKLKKLNAKIQAQTQKRLDAAWGWDIDRETYDNLILISYAMNKLTKEYTSDVDF